MIRLKGLLTEIEEKPIDFSAATDFVSAMKSRGFSELEAIALAGNVVSETGGTFNSSVVQVGGGPGRGLFQWEKGGNRFKALEAYAEHKGTSWSDKNTQYNFIRNELLNNCNESGFDIKDHLPDYNNTYYTRLYTNNIHNQGLNLDTITFKISALIFACGPCRQKNSVTVQQRQNAAERIQKQLNGEVSDTKPTTSLTADNITLYPNPVNLGQEITIRISKDAIPSGGIDTLAVKIYTINGKLVKSHNWNNIQKGILQFNAPNTDGVYLVKLVQPNIIFKVFVGMQSKL